MDGRWCKYQPLQVPFPSTSEELTMAPSFSETYAGPSAFSEVEAVNLKNFLVPHNDTIKAYLTLHSYGEDILYPWGYATGCYPPDVNDLVSISPESD